MAFQTNISSQNAFEMLPEEVNRPAKHHNGNIDQDFAHDLILPYEEDAVYYHPVERGDPFRFQVSSTAHTVKTLEVIDCHGLVALTISLTNTATIIGNVSVDGDAMPAYDYRLPNLNGITDDGVYYLLYTITYIDGITTKKYISPPFLLKDTHEGTILVEYRHSINKDKFFYEQIPTINRLRVKGCIPPSSITNESNDVVFADQEQDTTLLNSIAFNGWKLYIGGDGDGVPAWLYRKLGVVFGCDELYIDGRAYTKGDSKWEKYPVGGVPLFGASLNLYLPDNSLHYQHTEADVTIYTNPGTYPYFVGYLEMFNGTGSVRLSEAITIEDLAGETALIASLNASLQLLELSGVFSKVGSNIIYTNGAGEAYRYSGNFIATDFFSYELTSAGFSYDTLMEFAQGRIGADWGDGSASYDFSNTSLFSTFLTNNYNSAATWTVRVFHDNTIERIIINEPTLNTFAGDLPLGIRQLQGFGISGSMTSFDFDFIAPVLSTLEQLILRSDIATITHITGTTPFGPNFRYLDMGGNSLSSTAVDNLLIAVNDAVNTNGGPDFGTFDTYNQSPPAPWTIASLGAVVNLSSNHSWALFLD